MSNPSPRPWSRTLPWLPALGLPIAAVWPGIAPPVLAASLAAGSVMAAVLLLCRWRRAGTVAAAARPSPPPAAASPETHWGRVLDHAPIGLWKLDRYGRTRFANAHLGSLCGGRVPASLAASGLRIAGPGDPDGPLGLPTGREVEADLPGVDGHQRTVSVSASPWQRIAGEGEGELCVLALIDISPLKTAKARLEHLAEHDPLTGLANRPQFRAALAAMCASREGGGLLLLDLDGFRRTNARHGMAAGDAVLRAAADRLRGAVRPHDLVCRLDGDEFAVVAFGASENATAAIVERLTDALSGTLRFEEAELPLTAATGAACTPSHATDPDDLLRAADLALLEARAAAAASQCIFRPELRLAADAANNCARPWPKPWRGPNSTSPSSRSATCRRSARPAWKR